MSDWKDKRFVPFTDEVGISYKYGVYDTLNGVQLISFDYQTQTLGNNLREQIATRLNTLNDERPGGVKGAYNLAREIYEEITKKKY